MKLEFKEEVWTGDTYLGVISILMIFKARRLSEITNGVNVIGEERKPRGTRKDHQRNLGRNSRWHRKETWEFRVSCSQVKKIFDRGSDETWQRLSSKMGCDK